MQNGTKVEWSSSSAGTTKVKQGEIVGKILANQHPTEAIHQLERQLKAKSAYGGGTARKEVSYVVLVPSKSGRGKPTLYWPRPSALREVSGV